MTHLARVEKKKTKPWGRFFKSQSGSFPNWGVDVFTDHLVSILGGAKF